MKTEDSVNKQKWIYLLPLFYGQCEDSVWVLALLDLQKSYCFPGGTSDKEPACQCRRPKGQGFDPWVKKIPQRRAQKSTPVSLPGESHRQRSLMGYSP